VAKSQTVLPVFFDFHNYKEQLDALESGRAVLDYDSGTYVRDGQPMLLLYSSVNG
jgi:hypothetical protein